MLVQLLLNAIRGFLIGVAEVIPGVSGGTVALVVGIYEKVLAQAAHVSRAIATLFSKPSEAIRHLGRLDFRFLIPIGIGMVLAIMMAAAVLEPLFVTSPEILFALFAGLIAASIVVPFKMVTRWQVQHFTAAALAAIAAFMLTSLPQGNAANPAAWVVFVSATVAICALVLPGVSGSFFLLAIGMYQPTIAAVNDRDLAYLGVFALGALVGLLSFAVFMQFLLDRFRAMTLAVMTGLMLGSLRALWPWQTESRQLLPPSDPLAPLLAFCAGALIVSGLIVWQRRHNRASAQ